MMKDQAAELAAGIAFILIGCITWFFSSRPRLFVRTFAPPDALREVARGILRDPIKYQRSARFIALLQGGVGLVIEGLAILTWLLH